jgi:hypothetical protein
MDQPSQHQPRPCGTHQPEYSARIVVPYQPERRNQPGERSDTSQMLHHAVTVRGTFIAMPPSKALPCRDVELPRPVQLLKRIRIDSVIRP